MSENESKVSRDRVENDPKAETGPELAQKRAETGPEKVPAQYWHCYACGWTMVAWDKPDECEHCGETELDAEGPAEPDEPADADSKICASCREPGACCTGFPLFPGGEAGRAGHFDTPLEAIIWAASQFYESPLQDRHFVGLPFLPTRRMTKDHPGVWLWRCVDLLPNGKCGNYENRPYGPCVLYKPQQDRLCAEHPDHWRYE